MDNLAENPPIDIKFEAPGTPSEDLVDFVVKEWFLELSRSLPESDPKARARLELKKNHRR